MLRYHASEFKIKLGISFKYSKENKNGNPICYSIVSLIWHKTMSMRQIPDVTC
uniref:Uncharacterized protein n=1 Tax=Arundo donax TaxID=35708 RepID=A0A0A9HNL6_ARUDO